MTIKYQYVKNLPESKIKLGWKPGFYYVLWSRHKKKGRYRRLGVHKTYKAALRQERGIWARRGSK